MSFGFDKVVSDYIGLSTLTEQSFCPGIETELFYKEGAYDYSIWDEREDIPAIWEIKYQIQTQSTLELCAHMFMPNY